MMILIQCAIALMSLTGEAPSFQVQAQGHPVEVLIPSGEGRVLAGTLTLPENGSPPFPVAVSLTGSGPHYRDGNRAPDHPYRPFRAIAGALASRGVAMLRLDDRGVGQSTGDANATTGDDVAKDTHIAIDWLRHRTDIDASRVALIGHSFGGAVAPLVAVEDPSGGRTGPDGRARGHLPRDHALPAPLSH